MNYLHRQGKLINRVGHLKKTRLKRKTNFPHVFIFIHVNQQSLPAYYVRNL